MNLALIVAACLVVLPIPGGGMIRNQIMKGAVSSWVLLAVGDEMFGCGVVDLGVEAAADEPEILDIEIEMDKRVKAPVPEVRKDHPRIVLTIMPEGEVKSGAGALLADDEAVLTHLREQRDAADGDANPRLHLRAAEGVAFGHLRRAIRLAAKEGIDEVIFITIKGGPDREKEREAAKPGKDGNEEIDEDEREREIKLPEAKSADDQPAIMPFFIKIDAKERIYANTGAAQELLDAEAAARELPLLDRRVELYAAAARLGKEEPVVYLYAEPGVRQGRVMQVIDLLQRHKIDHLTFVDLIDEE